MSHVVVLFAFSIELFLFLPTTFPNKTLLAIPTLSMGYSDHASLQHFCSVGDTHLFSPSTAYKRDFFIWHPVVHILRYSHHKAVVAFLFLASNLRQRSTVTARDQAGFATDFTISNDIFDLTPVFFTRFDPPVL